MTNLRTKAFAAAAIAVLLAGCQVDKSSNPLSPQVAGPIEGVVLSVPHILEPGADWELRTRDQPVQLLFQNAGTNGSRPVTHSFDLATDAEFRNIIFARTGIEPGGDGMTKFQMPEMLAAGTYWWRTRATDGANTGPYSAPVRFQVLAQVVLAPPIPSSPSNGSTISGLTPEFRIKAGARSGVTDDIEYVLQVSNNSTFTSMAAIFTEKESWPETKIADNYTFLYNRTYYWRVRAWHTGDGGDLSNWSSVLTFRTPPPPVQAPPPVVGEDPAPNSPSGSGGSACSSNDGDDIARCISLRYPSYLAAGVSLSRRVANMQFLRDRMIEHAKCRGLDVGRNAKRNTSTISNDFVAWRTGGRTEGVDIARGYDNPSQRLELMWHTYGPPNYGHPFYRDFGPVTCK
jgi:hypothetical protein